MGPEEAQDGFLGPNGAVLDEPVVHAKVEGAPMEVRFSWLWVLGGDGCLAINISSVPSVTGKSSSRFFPVVVG